MRSDTAASPSPAAAGWLESIVARAGQMSGWEMLAVALALTYLLLAVRQIRLCWVAAFASTALYTLLFWQLQLLMQSALNIYYMAMAVYGWRQWQRGSSDGQALAITRWSWRKHAVALAAIAGCSLVSGMLLARHTEAAWPYLDSLITWGAVVATFMVAHKVLANWGYWMMINSLAVFMFLDRGMLLTAGLHTTYLVISVFGWIAWQRDYCGQQPKGS